MTTETDRSIVYGQALREKAKKSREALAKAEFSKEVILEACRARAADGFTWCEIRPSRHIDVNKTKAWAETKQQLADQQLRFEWVIVRERPDVPGFKVLTISWD